MFILVHLLYARASVLTSCRSVSSSTAPTRSCAPLRDRINTDICALGFVNCRSNRAVVVSLIGRQPHQNNKPSTMTSKPKITNNSSAKAQHANSGTTLQSKRAPRASTTTRASTASAAALRTTQGAIESATVEATAPSPPTSANNNEKKRSSRADERAADVGSNKKKKTADKSKKQEANPNERGFAVGSAAADDRLHRELLEVRDSLTRLQADNEADERARDAATDVIEAIAVMLKQFPPVENSLGLILLNDHGWIEEDLLGDLGILDEALGERLGVWQWEWLYDHGHVKQCPDEYITWLLLFVPIRFADMCKCMALHYDKEVPVRPPPSRDDRFADESATSKDDDEASADTRAFAVADDDPIEYMPKGSSAEVEPVLAPRHRRRCTRG
jgi:hypothetical protein